jgi:hypothetical protein
VETVLGFLLKVVMMECLMEVAAYRTVQSKQAFIVLTRTLILVSVENVSIFAQFAVITQHAQHATLAILTTAPFVSLIALQ